MKEILAKIHAQLTNRGKTIATAESCTGGLLAAALTDAAGSSKFFVGGIIAYANAIKLAELAVPDDVLGKFGAVSKEVVLLMAENVRVKFDTDFALATTGIAGPEGGSSEKPVGTVWVAFASRKKSHATLLHLKGDRASIRQQTVSEIFKELLGLLEQ